MGRVTSIAGRRLGPAYSLKCNGLRAREGRNRGYVRRQQCRNCSTKKYLFSFLQIALGSEHAGQRGKSMSSELNWLSRQARPVLSLLIVNLVCMVLGSGLSLLDPLVVRWLIDVALPKRDLRLVLFGTLIFCVVYLASVIVSYLSSFISCVVTQKMVFRIRVSLLRRIQTLPARYHGNTQVGETLYRIEQDVDRVAELSGDIFPLVIRMVIMGVMVLVTMGILNWHLTLVIVPLLPVFYVLKRRYAIRLKGGGRQRSESVGEDRRVLAGTLGGHVAVATAESYRHTGQKVCSPGSRRCKIPDQAASDRNVLWRSLHFSDRSWHGADPWLWRLRSNSEHFDRWWTRGFLRLRLPPVRARQHCH